LPGGTRFFAEDGLLAVVGAAPACEPETNATRHEHAQSFDSQRKHVAYLSSSSGRFTRASRNPKLML
jgi:hypothetical protein